MTRFDGKFWKLQLSRRGHFPAILTDGGLPFKNQGLATSLDRSPPRYAYSVRSAEYQDGSFYVALRSFSRECLNRSDPGSPPMVAYGPTSTEETQCQWRKHLAVAGALPSLGK